MMVAQGPWQPYWLCECSSMQSSVIKLPVCTGLITLDPLVISTLPMQYISWRPEMSTILVVQVFQHANWSYQPACLYTKHFMPKLSTDWLTAKFIKAWNHLAHRSVLGTLLTPPLLTFSFNIVVYNNIQCKQQIRNVNY